MQKVKARTRHHHRGCPGDERQPAHRRYADQPARADQEPRDHDGSRHGDVEWLRQRVDRQRVLRERVEPESADLDVAQDEVQRRAVEPGRPVALEHRRDEVDQRNLDLDKALRPGDDQGLGQGAAAATGLAAGVERVGGAAGAEHHVEGQEHQQDVGSAVGDDVAMVDGYAV